MFVEQKFLEAGDEGVEGAGGMTAALAFSASGVEGSDFGNDHSVQDAAASEEEAPAEDGFAVGVGLVFTI